MIPPAVWLTNQSALFLLKTRSGEVGKDRNVFYRSALIMINCTARSSSCCLTPWTKKPYDSVGHWWLRNQSQEQANKFILTFLKMSANAASCCEDVSILANMIAFYACRFKSEFCNSRKLQIVIKQSKKPLKMAKICNTPNTHGVQNCLSTSLMLASLQNSLWC